MKTIFWILGLFAVAVGIAWVSHVFHAGYVIVVMPPYRVDFSLNMAVILALVLLMVLYFVMRLVEMLWHLPRDVHRYRTRQREHAGHHALKQAMLAHLEGRFQRAEREAMRADIDELPPDERGLARVLAARAAHEIHDYDSRDAHLAALADGANAVHLARDMQTAYMCVEEQRFEEALEALSRVRAVTPSLTVALKLELKIRVLQKNPEAVLSLVDKLYKSDNLPAELAHRYRRAAWQIQLERFHEASQIHTLWQSVAAAERCHPDIVLRVAERYVQLKEVDAAAGLLADALDQEWQGELVEKLGECACQLSESARLSLVKRAELWLESHRRDPQLLLLLGRLALGQQLWGKAQNYFEASLSVAPSLTAHAALARLFESLGREHEAQQHYQASVDMAMKLSGRCEIQRSLLTA